MTDLAFRRRDADIREHRARAASVRLLIGLSLIAIFWPIAWLQLRPVSDYYFFPLWLGYIFSVDGLVAWRTGSSPMGRDGWRVLWLFAISVPLWWVFEAFNQVVDNWRYHAPVRYTTLEHALLASLSFSTVVPAVLTTSELVRLFRLDPLRRLPPILPGRWLLVGVHMIGWLMVLSTFVWPQTFFPLVWISVVLVLDPIATWLGGRSLASFIAGRDWSPLFNIALGTLICGWFWEMWNFYSLPKWSYSIPHAEFLHVFEMPLLGFGGYIPFGYEVYLVTVVVRRLLPGLEVPDVPVSSRSD